MVFQLDGCQETVNTFILKVSEGHKESVKAHNTVIVLLLVGYKSTYNHSNSGNRARIFGVTSLIVTSLTVTSY